METMWSHHHQVTSGQRPVPNASVAHVHRWWLQASPGEKPRLVLGVVSDMKKCQVLPREMMVGGWATPLKNMTSSVGMMWFPRYGKIIQMFQTTNHNEDFSCKNSESLWKIGVGYPQECWCTYEEWWLNWWYRWEDHNQLIKKNKRMFWFGFHMI